MKRSFWLSLVRMVEMRSVMSCLVSSFFRFISKPSTFDDFSSESNFCNENKNNRLNCAPTLTSHAILLSPRGS